MRALIIDPALRSQGGHNYDATLRLKRELTGLGVESDCLASQFADRDVVQGLSATPCFSRNLYMRTEWTHQAFVKDVEETWQQLSSGIRQLGRRRPDFLILPSCDQVLALALAKYLQHLRFVPKPHVLLWLLFAPHWKKAHDDPTVGGLYGEYGEAFAALKAALGGARIKVYCETPVLADLYSEITGFQIAVAPSPSLISAREAGEEKSLGRSPAVVCTGVANEAKGYRLLPAAVECVLKKHRDVRFLIHGALRGSDAEGDASIFSALSELGPRVTVRTDVLTQEEYRSWLSHADLVLLPYDPVIYGSRGSLVFTEARRLGIPVVATRGCDFARPAFEGGWGIEIVDRSECGVARATNLALEQLDLLTMKARGAMAGNRHGDVASILEPAIRAIRADWVAAISRLAWRLAER